VAYESADAPETDGVASMAARPEDIHVEPAPPDDDRLVATVDLVEMRGSTAYFICQLDGRELTILKEDNDDVTGGDRVALDFDFDAVNFFDETGERVELAREAEVQS
jgi:ABC-type sugar transport system ATPase subunit